MWCRRCDGGIIRVVWPVQQGERHADDQHSCGERSQEKKRPAGDPAEGLGDEPGVLHLARRLLDGAEHLGTQRGRWLGQGQSAKQRGLPCIHFCRLVTLGTIPQMLLQVQLFLWRELCSPRQHVREVLVSAHGSVP